MLIAIIAGLIFAAVAVLITGWLADSRSARMQDRFDQVMASAGFAPGSPLQRELERSLYDRAFASTISQLVAMVTRLSPSSALQGARSKLDMAGNPRAIDAATFVALRIVSLAAGVVAAVALGLMWQQGPPVYRLVGALLVALCGAMFPDYLLDGAIRSRQSAITKSLPDIIDLVVVSAEAGTGLDGALAEVVRRKHGPMPDEFNRVLTEIRLGKRRQEAWQDMAARCNVQDITNLVAALHQAEQLGVSIGKTLRTQADTLRQRRSMRIRTAAATMSVKMLFPLIFCIFPALFVVVLGPGAMSIDKAMTGLGW